MKANGGGSASLAYSVVLIAVLGCRNDKPAVMTSGGTDSIRAGVVDSIFPVEEEIRRFKAARNDAAAARLEGASASRDALVERFMKALEARDTTDLRVMALAAAEFIDLYYPTSVYSHPPYKQSPEIAWLLMQQQSQKGIKRTLERFGGVPPRFKSYSCKSEPRVEGANRYWEECSVRWTPSVDAPSPARVFGSIMERNGRFKFVSFDNDL